MRTLTTTSTETNGIYMRSAPKNKLHGREVPTIFEGNIKSDTTAGSSTTFKNWASELQIYMSLEDHNLIDIMETVKRQTTELLLLSTTKSSSTTR
eukprot:5689279-Amphidinium_carterae.3